MKRSTIAVLALLATLPASFIPNIAEAQAATRVTPCSAATANNEICITGAAVTTDTNGNAIAGVTYRVEQRAGTAAYATVATGLTQLQYLAKNLAPGSYTFRVFASCASCTTESAASNATTGTATAIPVVPSTPVIIIAATINANGPPTYRILQSLTLAPNEVVLVAPASMKPLFAAR